MTLGIDVDFLRLPTTPLEMLVVVVVLAVIFGAVLVVVTVLATPLVDRRWPADEPLDQTELLWGEAGGYIQRHFKGLDPEASKDLATQFVEVKVPAAEYIIEQGDPATAFYVLKDGQAEVIQRTDVGGLVREDVIRRHGAGESFGEIGILRRTARTASVRAVSDCVVLQLTAEDFVAGAAYSAAEGNELLGRVDQYLVADRRRAE
ncbi:MAG: cyclic nucleotide-binding domain-containing protein, partial [Acidimicrobiales bacterium]